MAHTASLGVTSTGRHMVFNEVRICAPDASDMCNTANARNSRESLSHTVMLCAQCNSRVALPRADATACANTHLKLS